MTDATTLATGYFDAWRARDPAALRRLLAYDATFVEPLGRADNADEYADSIQRLSAITTDVVVEKMIADGDDVLTRFELHTSVAPPTPVVNWTHIERGKIARVRATFDPRAIIATVASSST